MKAMVDTQEKNPKKRAITEEDVCTLLQRYSAVTVLSMLKEVSQLVNVKIDWQKLMEKTETGIKSAREYQMLWRHLAYRQPLIHNIASNDQPLDDDSDLEYELEAYPLVSTIDATEASNCVKALTSPPSNKSRILNSSSCVVPKASSEYQQGQKQVQAAGTFGEKMGANGSKSNNQKKRKSDSGEADLELIANRKGESNGKKQTTHRAQRGNNSKKKQGSSNIEKLSDAQLATRYALDMALKDNPSAGCGTVKASTSERNLPMGSSSKLCPQKEALQSKVSADPKAAQSKNAVDIRRDIPVGKTFTAGISSVLPPNVHLICTGPTTKPMSARPPVPPVSELPKTTVTSTDRITNV